MRIMRNLTKAKRLYLRVAKLLESSLTSYTSNACGHLWVDDVSALKHFNECVGAINYQRQVT